MHAALFRLEGQALEIVKRQASGKFPTAALFPGKDGTNACSSWTIGRHFERVVEAVAGEHPEWKLEYGRGKDQVSFHTLRHSFATLGHAAGMSQLDLQLAGNWKSATMLVRYCHAEDTALREKLRAVGDAVLGSGQGA